MDGMMMASGTPWFDSPITLDGDRTYECSFNTTWQCDFQTRYWTFWYEADHRYALPTVAFFTATILAFAIAFFINDFAPRRLLQSKPVQRTTAFFRWLSYRTFRVAPLNWNTAPVGVLLLGALGLVFFFSMVLGPRPYFWPNYDGSSPKYGGSMPIATRSGWLATGCLPFVILMAGKSNIVTLVTGVSHERLQVFHRWISYAMFVLSLIHTFPFIVYHIRIGDMVEQWQTSIFYWTGVVALLALAYLIFGSFGPIRNLGYEWFKYTHFLAALIFTLFFFFHCDFTLTSAQYFVVTLVLFAASYLHRHLRIYLEHGFGHRATLRLERNGFVRISIWTTATWQPGQHFFLRFLSLGVHAFTVHPFSAASTPERSDHPENNGQTELVFYVRPQGGFTARLAKHAAAHPERQLRVLLDGPYGGVSAPAMHAAARQLIIVGGSGAGWAIPILSRFLNIESTLIRNVEHDDGKKCTPPPPPRRMRVVAATRDFATQSWFAHEVTQEIMAFTAVPRDLVQLDIFQTNGAPPTADEKQQLDWSLQRSADVEEEDPEKGGAAVVSEDLAASSSGSSNNSNEKLARVSSDPVNHAGRPDLARIIADEAASGVGPLSVFVCGPLSMQHDVANAVAEQQKRVMRHGGDGVYLHMEHFSWA